MSPSTSISPFCAGNLSAGCCVLASNLPRTRVVFYNLTHNLPHLACAMQPARAADQSHRLFCDILVRRRTRRRLCGVGTFGLFHRQSEFQCDSTLLSISKGRQDANKSKTNEVQSAYSEGQQANQGKTNKVKSPYSEGQDSNQSKTNKIKSASPKDKDADNCDRVTSRCTCQSIQWAQRTRSSTGGTRSHPGSQG